MFKIVKRRFLGKQTLSKIARMKFLRKQAFCKIGRKQIPKKTDFASQRCTLYSKKRNPANKKLFKSTKFPVKIVHCEPVISSGFSRSYGAIKTCKIKWA